MATSGFLLYLLSASSIAILSVLYLSNSASSSSSSSDAVLSAALSVEKTWPVRFLIFFFSLFSMRLFLLFSFWVFLGIGAELETCGGDGYRISRLRLRDRRRCRWWRHFCSYAYFDYWVRHQICRCHFQMYFYYSIQYFNPKSSKPPNNFVLLFLA